MSAQVSPPSASLIPQVVDPTTDELIKRGRVKSPGDLVTAHQSLYTADWESSRARALVQAQADGQPPYSESRDRIRGYGGRSNVNWGLADQALSEAVLPYNDILDSLDIFGTVPTRHGDQQMQDQWTAIISEEITRTIKSWEDFDDVWQQNVLLFVQEGLSFAFFEDDRDWRWRVYGQQFLKFPRRVRANVNDCDIFTCQMQVLPHILFRKIENPEVAEEMGWNVKAVKDALKTASPKGLRTDDPQEWERAWKDNDIVYGVTCATVEVVQGWVRELDGTVSHYIARADGEGDWLYKCEGKYKSMKRLLVAYKYGVGTNGDFQSIRGLGQKTFSSASGINRLLCKALDMMVHEATPVLQAENEDAQMDQALVPTGPYNRMAPGVSFVEQKLPNFAQGLQPGIEMLRGVFSARSQPYAPQPAAALDRTQRTKYEMQLKSEQSGKLTTSGMNLFFRAWGDHFREIVRRLCCEDYTQEDPGGHEAWEFRTRCLKRGVPLEAIYAVDIGGIEVNMGIGKGSASERRAVVSMFNEVLYYRADQYAQQKINNMTAAAYAGSRVANELFPADQGLRPPVDLQIALLENTQMSQTGQMAEVVPNQDHIVHVNTHLQKLFELNGALTELQIDLEQAIPQMMPIWQHAGEHMQFVDPMNPASKEFKEALQQLGEVITNGQKHLDAEAKRQQKEMGAEGEGGENYGGTPASTYKQSVQAQAKLVDLELDTAKKQQDLAFDAEKRKQELAFRDAQFAQNIRHKAAELKLKKPPGGGKAA
jgi:hypothetical protein